MRQYEVVFLSHHSCAFGQVQSGQEWKGNKEAVKAAVPSIKTVCDLLLECCLQAWMLEEALQCLTEVLVTVLLAAPDALSHETGQDCAVACMSTLVQVMPCSSASACIILRSRLCHGGVRQQAYRQQGGEVKCIPGLRTVSWACKGYGAGAASVTTSPRCPAQALQTSLSMTASC